MSPVTDPGYNAVIANLRAELASLRAELANLRGELDQRRRAEFEAIVEVVRGYSNDVFDQVKALTTRTLTELFDDIHGRFAALQARVDDVLPDRKRPHRFARERADEVSEPPNPPPPRRLS